MFCVKCDCNIDIGEDFNTCELCEGVTCRDCKKENLCYEVWLEIGDSTCSTCKKSGCQSCLEICRECANEGICFKLFCRHCHKMNRVPCNYHDWFVCETHANVSCGQCRANRNYDARSTF